MCRRRCSIVLLLPLLAGCATTSKPFQDTGQELWARRAATDIFVRVSNDHYLPVRVTAIWEGADYFLGEITPGATEILRLPGNLTASYGEPRFLADPSGSTQEFLTDPVSCQRARWIEWRLKRNLHPSRPHVL